LMGVSVASPLPLVETVLAPTRKTNGQKTFFFTDIGVKEQYALLNWSNKFAIVPLPIGVLEALEKYGNHLDKLPSVASQS